MIQPHGRQHEHLDVCTYWSNGFKVTDVTGCKMFPRLSRLAKAFLTISHGNAVAECGFSVNTAVLSKDRMSLDGTTVQALRPVKETIRLHVRPTAVPMTRSTISAVCHLMLTQNT